ncbi:MAG: hypothetical protein PHI98_08305 [Eubacteriales bacterium]|nr:hypothetical protein [Eubacteriales bacterium]
MKKAIFSFLIVCMLMVSISGLAENAVAIPKEYQAVLLGQEAFVDAFDQSPMLLDDWLTRLEDVPLYYSQFSVLDLNVDGIPEVVLSVGVGEDTDYGFLILCLREGTVYGYEAVYRAMQDLKSDGSFSFSSGAADNGFGTAILDGNEFSINELAYCQSEENGGISYFVGGEAVAEDAFRLAVEQQAQKENAHWYEYSILSVN